MENDYEEEEYVPYEVWAATRRRALLMGCLSAVPFGLFVLIYLTLQAIQKFAK